MSAKTDSGSAAKKDKKFTGPSTPSSLKTPLPSTTPVLPLADFYEEEQPVVRSLFKAFVENVSDVTFGNPSIAKFIREGLLCVSDGVLRVSPSIQNDEAFTWWITTLISFTAKTMLSVEGLGAKDRTAIYNNLCKLSPFLSRKSSDSSNSSKKLPSSCKKCRSNRSNESSESPTSHLPKGSCKLIVRKRCPGAVCPKRKRMQCEFEAQTNILQNYWRLIRQSVKKLMRGEPLSGIPRMKTSGEKKILDVETRKMALSMGVNALCKLDPQQLFKRLESVCTEHVMTLKVSLWSILVTPNKVPCLKKYYDLRPPANAIAIAQAKLFIKALLDEFSTFQDVVKTVSEYLVPLEVEYLKQFGVTWNNVNYHIFDKVIYQDELFRSFVPHMEAALQVKLTGDGPVEISIDKIPPAPWPLNDDFQKHLPELLSGVTELVKSFKLFHRLMLTSREMFRRADLLIQAFINQQQFLRNRTKVEILEKDLEFFTQQRRMMRDLARGEMEKKMLSENLSEANSCFSCTNADHVGKENCDKEIDAADEAEFVRRFKDLFNREPEESSNCRSGRSRRETMCKYCSHPHCSCDECEFYHMILCGLIDCGIDCMVDVVNFHMDSDVEQEMHSVITLDADEEQLLCSGGPLGMDLNVSPAPQSKSKSTINKNKSPKKGRFLVRDTLEATNAFMAEETKKLANFAAFKEVKRTVEESAEDEKVNTEMIFGVPAGVLESSSLFTLHETSELCKQMSDAQSNWDAGFEFPFTCKCEQEDSEDEYNYDTSHLPSPKSSQSKQRLNRTIPRKSVLMKRAKSSTATATAISMINSAVPKLTSTADGQCYISEDKKSVVHVDKKGICLTQITKTKTARGRFMPKRIKQASSNGAAGLEDGDVIIEDSDGISDDESSEMKAADIQRISEKIVQEIERSFTNEGGLLNGDFNNFSDKAGDGKNRGCFSNFFNPDCRKLIESLIMQRQNSDTNTNSTQSMVCEEDEDTGDSHSVDLSVDDECEHDHDSCSTQSGEEENRDRYSRCDCCYCTYLSGDMPSRHDGRRNEEIRERLRKVLKKREKQWDAERGHSLSSDVRDRVSEADAKVEIKNEIVEERSLEELLQFINEKTPADAQLSSSRAAKKARQKQRRMEEKKKAEEEERAKKEALEKEKAENEAKLVAEKLKRMQDEKSKPKKRQKQKQQDANPKKSAIFVFPDKESLESSTYNEVSSDIDQITSAKAANKTRQQQKKLEEKRKQEEDRQRKLAEERQRQEAVKKEKAEKEARLNEEKRKRTEEQRLAKLEKAEKKKAAREENKKLENNKAVLQSKHLRSDTEVNVPDKEVSQQQIRAELPVKSHPVELQIPAVDLPVVIGEQLKVSSQIEKKKSDGLHSNVDVSSVPPSYMDASSSYFLAHGAESLSQQFPYQFSVPGKEESEEMQYLRQHASLIATAAAADGTPLPPLSSLSVEQQQQYFAWIKQMQMAPFYPVPLTAAPSMASAAPGNVANYTNTTLNPGFVAPLHSTSLPSSRYGAIGEKLPQRKTFNQYAAYDRETNHILGISQPTFAQFGVLSSTSAVSSPTPSHVHRPSSVTSIMTSTNAAVSRNPVLKQEAARFCAIENTLSTTAILNNQPFQDPDCVKLEMPDKNCRDGAQPQNGCHFSSSPSLLAEKIGCTAGGLSSIWSHDDNAKRFVETEECAIFKFSEC